MNLARIHDKCSTKKFWERKIEHHCKMTTNEELRMKTSALSKLRNEWIRRLEIQTENQRSFNEECMSRAKKHQQIF
ncbi:protein FAM240C-like [Brienomyrus brachyistius]|uniref:protein FAM240C-like n=1 Tax=Brienomyrus brachyistius TaxID=42636 RepID=UPI0020B4283C|nr:protein FAM240C-like [Brienomyrus brachyistius]